MQGVDATGMDARPAHLGTVLELLLLPRQHGCGKGDSEKAETVMALQPCHVLLLFPLPLCSQIIFLSSVSSPEG